MISVIVIRYTKDALSTLIIGPGATVTSFIELLFVTAGLGFTFTETLSSDGLNVPVVREYHVRYTNDFQRDRIIQKIRNTVEHVEVFNVEEPAQTEKRLITNLDKLSW